MEESVERIWVKVINSLNLQEINVGEKKFVVIKMDNLVMLKGKMISLIFLQWNSHN